MRILVIQNFDNTSLGQFGSALEEAGAEVEMLYAHKGDALPARLDEHDGLVVLGGGQNARDDGAYPYLPDLAALMRDTALEGKAVLGICLGSQIFARGLGAENRIGTASEFAWREVALTEAGRTDPVLGVLPERFPIFQWHDDTFDLPDGAIHLAGNDVTANQAFRVGRAGYGIQFHFEADTKLVRQWCDDFASVVAERQPDWAGRHESEAALHGPAADEAGLALARAWVRAVG